MDIDKEKVDKLRKGESYFKTIDNEDVYKAVTSGCLVPTTDVSNIERCDSVIICVPTPLGKHKEPDTKYIESTMDSIIPYIKKGTLVVLESTTYPGCTREMIKHRIEKEKNYKCGSEVYVGYSPEREDPGNEDSNVCKVPKVISGETRECVEKVKELYGKICMDLIPVSTLETAEAVKLTENIFRCVNIALVNELKIIYQKMGISIYEVIDAAKTKPYGFMAFYPGPGLGGHCIPIDPYYLSWKAKENSTNARFIELAGEINNLMPGWVVTTLIDELNARKKSVNGARILVMGLAYKKNIDDDRESPAYPIIEELRRLGGEVKFHDPMINEIPTTRKYNILRGESYATLKDI